MIARLAGLARPGGNTTGFSVLSTELTVKRLELLKEVMPQAARIAILKKSGNPAHPMFIKEIEPTAGLLGFTYRTFEAQGSGRPTPSSYWTILLSSPLEQQWRKQRRATVCR